MDTRIQSKKARSSADWHPADIKAALEKSGWSMRGLARHLGVVPSAVTAVLRRPYPRMERAIAAEIGVEPCRIWPSRYRPDGQPAETERRRQGGKRAWVTRRSNMLRAVSSRHKDTTGAETRNVNDRGGK